MPAAFYGDDEGKSSHSIRVYVDGNIVTSWASGGMTSSFVQQVEVGVIGREIELRSSMGISIYEVRERYIGTPYSSFGQPVAPMAEV